MTRPPQMTANSAILALAIQRFGEQRLRQTRARLAIARTPIVTADTNDGVTDATSPETTTTVIINIVDTTGTVSISGTSSQDTNNASIL